MNVGLAFRRNAVRYPSRNRAVRRGAPAPRRDLGGARTSEPTASPTPCPARLGVEPGDRVALLVANRAEVVEVLGGITKAGAVYVGLNFRLGPAELDQIIDNARPRLLLCDTEHLPQTAEVAGKYELEVLDIDAEPYRSLVAAGSPAPPAALHEVRSDDDFCIVYTSGTTGRPKGVLFDHARVLQHATVTALEYEIDPAQPLPAADPAQLQRQHHHRAGAADGCRPGVPGQPQLRSRGVRRDRRAPGRHALLPGAHAADASPGPPAAGT